MDRLLSNKVEECDASKLEIERIWELLQQVRPANAVRGKYSTQLQGQRLIQDMLLRLPFTKHALWTQSFTDESSLQV